MLWHPICKYLRPALDERWVDNHRASCFSSITPKSSGSQPSMLSIIGQWYVCPTSLYFYYLKIFLSLGSSDCWWNGLCLGCSHHHVILTSHRTSTCKMTLGSPLLHCCIGDMKLPWGRRKSRVFLTQFCTWFYGTYSAFLWRALLKSKGGSK